MQNGHRSVIQLYLMQTTEAELLPVSQKHMMTEHSLIPIPLLLKAIHLPAGIQVLMEQA